MISIIYWRFTTSAGEKSLVPLGMDGFFDKIIRLNEALRQAQIDFVL
ncbi:hypothetical protein [Patiriisocius sp. Uisw_017]